MQSPVEFPSTKPSKIVSGIVVDDNVNPLLRYLARGCGYDLLDAELEAIYYGMIDTDWGDGPSFEYVFEGDSKILIRLSKLPLVNEQRRLLVLVVCPPDNGNLLNYVDAAVDVYSCFDKSADFLGLESLLLRTFSGLAPVGTGKIMNCTDTHLEVCPECQETYAEFAGKCWQELVYGKWEVSMSYGGITLLNDEAKAAMFPAYVALALKYKDTIEPHTYIGTSEAQSKFTASQRERIAVVETILKDIEQAKSTGL